MTRFAAAHSFYIYTFFLAYRLESLHLLAFISAQLASSSEAYPAESPPFIPTPSACLRSAASLQKKSTVLSRADHDGWVGEFFGGREYPLLWKEGEVYLLPLSEEDIGFYKAPGESAQIMVRISAHPLCDGSAPPCWVTKQGGCEPRGSRKGRLHLVSLTVTRW